MGVECFLFFGLFLLLLTVEGLGRSIKLRSLGMGVLLCILFFVRNSW